MRAWMDAAAYAHVFNYHHHVIMIDAGLVISHDDVPEL